MELSLEALIDFISQILFLGLVVFDQVGLESANETHFTDFLLPLDPLFEFVLLGQVGWYFRGLVLIITNELDVFLLLYFHEGCWTGFESHLVFLLFLILNLIFYFFRLFLTKVVLNLLIALFFRVILFVLFGHDGFFGMLQDFVLLILQLFLDWLKLQQKSFKISQSFVKLQTVPWS